jgi:hypothetical protein
MHDRLQMDVLLYIILRSNLLNIIYCEFSIIRGMPNFRG